MVMQHGDKGACERCGRVVLVSKLNDHGLCGACAMPDRAMPEMALAASLDMDAIVREVVEAGLNVEAALSWDALWRQIKTKLGLADKQPPTVDHYEVVMQAIQNTTEATQSASAKEEEAGGRRMDEAMLSIDRAVGRGR